MEKYNFHNQEKTACLKKKAQPHTKSNGCENQLPNILEVSAAENLSAELSQYFVKYTQVRFITRVETDPQGKKI